MEYPCSTAQHTDIVPDLVFTKFGVFHEVNNTVQNKHTVSAMADPRYMLECSLAQNPVVSGGKFDM